MKIQQFFAVNPLLALQECYQSLNESLTKFCEDQEITLLQGLILISLLFDQENKICPSDLKTVFRTSKSSVSQALSGLEYKGYIKRQLCPSDARSYFLILSQKGIILANHLIAALDSLQKQLEKTIGENELKNLIGHLHSIHQLMQTFSLSPLRPSNSSLKEMQKSNREELERGDSA